MSLDEKIQVRAYELWEKAGRPHGQDQAYWFRAVSEIAEEVLVDKVPAAKPRRRKPAARAAA